MTKTGQPSHIAALCVNESGNTLGSIDYNGKITVRDLSTGSTIASFVANVRQPTGLAFNSDTSLAAAYGENGSVAIADLISQQVSVCSARISDPVWDVKFTANGNTFAALHSDFDADSACVAVWSRTPHPAPDTHQMLFPGMASQSSEARNSNFQLVREWKFPASHVLSLANSGNEVTCLYIDPAGHGKTSTVHQLDVISGRSVREFQGPEEIISPQASHDQNLLAAFDNFTSSLNIWDISDGKHVREIAVPDVYNSQIHFLSVRDGQAVAIVAEGDCHCYPYPRINVLRISGDIQDRNLLSFGDSQYTRFYTAPGGGLIAGVSRERLKVVDCNSDQVRLLNSVRNPIRGVVMSADPDMLAYSIGSDVIWHRL